MGPQPQKVLLGELRFHLLHYLQFWVQMQRRFAARSELKGFHVEYLLKQYI